MKKVVLWTLAGISLLSSCGETGESPGPLEEPHRPRYHFTPPAHWMNDPNGMYYQDGEYHLHYQYYPDSTVWGPMHWGHAVSSDLIRWEHLPVSLYPDSLGYIFSGSAVVDYDNTSGFGQEDTPPVVAAFTHHDPEGERAGRSDFQNQSLAYSLDNGRTWTKYSGNPVLRNDTGIRDFRDPKIVWHGQSEKWIMALAVYDRVRFYGSDNLKDWAYLSEFGIPGDTRLWECPDLFPMRIPGQQEEKWVLLVSIQQQGPNGGTGTSYFIGDFDGTRFTADPQEQQWLDYGADNYAFVTWDNAPVGWGRRLGIGWMSNWQYAQQVPTEKWRSAMTLPRVLELVQEDSSYVLAAQPVPSVTGLRRSGFALPGRISGFQSIQGDFRPSRCELEFRVDLEATTAKAFGFTLKNTKGNRLEIRMDPRTNTLVVDRTESGPKGFSDAFFEGPHRAPLHLEGGSVDLRVFLDVSSIEIFANGGRLNFTDIFFPEEPFDTLEFWAEDGELVLSEGQVHALSTSWEEAP
ncbi:glycoside hydrolase family 32 protein [Robiginitalea sediminis]|uniref:glycoside hydrolase family 32 protein n=1 Tax=Robiginitalea sediminis TaxID=1982593 RepID=UPI001E5D9260|nr:glycoside hydrolase family 32 protein [Robiginitalea sediminis]